MRNVFVLWKDSEANIKNPGFLHILNKGVLCQRPIHTGTLELLSSPERVGLMPATTQGMYHLYANLFGR